MKTTVTVQGRTLLPAQLCKAHHIGPNTQLEWVDDGATIRVVPLPTDTIRAAKGRTQGLRQKLRKARKQDRR